MLFTSKIYLGESGCWQGMIGADSWFPLPGERARVRGASMKRWPFFTEKIVGKVRR